MQTEKMASIRLDIMSLDVSELSAIISTVQNRREVLNLQAKSNFSIGDKVEFTSSRDGGIITGLIVKINIKKIVIQVSESMGSIRWTVPASMISHVKETKTKEEND